MTLIASFHLDGIPALLGDLILSGPEMPDKKISIPSIGDINQVFPKGSGWSITGLTQKVIIISDKCAIAWSGSYLAAWEVIEEIKKLHNNNLLTLTNINNYLNNLKPTILNLEFSITGWVLENEGFHRFSLNVESSESPYFSGLLVGGTGGEAVKPSLSGLSLGSIQRSRDISSVEELAGRALAYIGGLIAHEASSHESLLRYYGGGYEVVAYFNNAFRKLDEFTFVFWRATMADGNAQISLPNRIIKQCYHDDLLIIMVIDLLDMGYDPLITTRRDVFYVTPPGVATSHYSAQFSLEQNLNSKFICHCVLSDLDGRLGYLSRIDYNPNLDGPARFSIGPNGFKLECEENFIISLISLTKEKIFQKS